MSDLQIPFHHHDAIPFLKRVQRFYKIGNENVYCVGDELDLHWLSSYLHNPNMRYSAVTEIEAAQEFLYKLYDAFPTMKLCFSNHGRRRLKKAFDAGIPEIWLRSYRDVIDAPKTWHWARSWVVRDKKAWWMVEHGHKWGGTSGLEKAVRSNPYSTVFGHNHTRAGVIIREWEAPGTTVEIERRNHKTIRKWGMNVGCLTNRQEVAFEYNEDHELSDVLSCGVVRDFGMWPEVIPYEA